MISHVVRRRRRAYGGVCRLPHWLTALLAALPLGVAIGVGVVANLGG